MLNLRGSEEEVEMDPMDGGGVVCLDDYTVQMTYETFFVSYLNLFGDILPIKKRKLCNISCCFL